MGASAVEDATGRTAAALLTPRFSVLTKSTRHPEQSEGSGFSASATKPEIPRFARNDIACCAKRGTKVLRVDWQELDSSSLRSSE